MIRRTLGLARQLAKLRRGRHGSRPLRIAYGRIFHEACGASPVLTTQQDFLRLHALEAVSYTHLTLPTSDLV